ncbi:hypothetical protein PLANPX_4834 [Lacipirellula parvula]|uniref:Uncharacterized protein n=1 Tax=Lacipirellula parvula TaxID=2650471 RepID=A0A5K7XGQ7_9BACT|nr:hypothetical protein PLANPX_4834 [Lacipirellula parvula]
MQSGESEGVSNVFNRPASLRRTPKLPEAASFKIALSSLSVGQETLQPGFLLLHLFETLGLVHP